MDAGGGGGFGDAVAVGIEIDLEADVAGVEALEDEDFFEVRIRACERPVSVDGGGGRHRQLLPCGGSSSLAEIRQSFEEVPVNPSQSRYGLS